MVISSSEDYGGCLQIHYQNSCKKIPYSELVFDYDMDNPVGNELSVLPTTAVSWPSKSAESAIDDEITWSDFEFGFMLRKIDPISSLVDGLRNYLKAALHKWNGKAKVVKSTSTPRGKQKNAEATSSTAVDRKNNSKKRKHAMIISDDEVEEGEEGEDELL